MRRHDHRCWRTRWHTGVLKVEVRPSSASGPVPLRTREEASCSSGLGRSVCLIERAHEPPHTLQQNRPLGAYLLGQKLLQQAWACTSARPIIACADGLSLWRPALLRHRIVRVSARRAVAAVASRKVDACSRSLVAGASSVSLSSKGSSAG